MLIRMIGAVSTSNSVASARSRHAFNANSTRSFAADCLIANSVGPVDRDPLAADQADRLPGNIDEVDAVGFNMRGGELQEIDASGRLASGAASAPPVLPHLVVLPGG